MNGTFEDFLDALLAFESGWDRERYNSGIIQNWQLDQWAGGSVADFYPEYSSWSELTDEEWETMAYRSMNVFGFVGYQFGEALLIDLGYYDDDVYYLNGADTNTWDGAWTGKNGANSLEDFMTKEVQDQAILDAFGHNLEIIEDGLEAAGTSLDAFLGTTRTYAVNGQEVSVELTLTGILAGAHLNGAPAMIDLLLNETVANDEFGTSTLQYIAQFGGYESPQYEDLIDQWLENLTGDEGLGSNRGSANVDADTADVAITWSWGQNEVVTDFDPDSGTIRVDWLTADDLEIYEENGSAVFAVPSNNQTTTLQGVSLDDLSLANFTIMDESAAEEILSLIGSEEANDDDDDGASDDTGDDGASDDNGDDGASDDDGDDGASDDDGGSDDTSDEYTGPTSEHGTADVTKQTATVVVTWAWGKDTDVTDFDPATDTIFVDWFSKDAIEVSEVDGSVVFSMPGNNQTITLEGVSLSDLSEDNFTIKDTATAAEILNLVGAAASDDDSGDDTDTGDDSGNQDDGASDGGSADIPDDGVDVHQITWNWAATEVISDFDISEDVLDFGSLPAALVSITESDEDLMIEVIGNGGHTYVLENIQAEDLSLANLEAPDWNENVLEQVVDQLEALGNDNIA
ncbi:hypothetical protein AAFN47_09775 [Hoeflea sp. CAU 1731]